MLIMLTRSMAVTIEVDDGGCGGSDGNVLGLCMWMPGSDGAITMSAFQWVNVSLWAREWSFLFPSMMPYLWKNGGGDNGDDGGNGGNGGNGGCGDCSASYSGRSEWKSRSCIRT